MNIQTLTDFLMLAGGVKRFNLFNNNPVFGDQYFMEHLNIVVEVKEVNDYVYLLQRRPDIVSLLGEGFDFDIINSGINAHLEEVEEEEEVAKGETMAQTDIEFHKNNEHRFLAIEVPNEEEENEVNEKDNVERVKEENEVKEKDNVEGVKEENEVKEKDNVEEAEKKVNDDDRSFQV